MRLRKRILELVNMGFFKVVPLSRVNYGPIGPHPMGSYEVWCPREHFPRAFSFFTLYRSGLTVLVHPLTREEVVDHSTRAVWMGTPAPVDLTALSKQLPKVPAQYPELGLGYSIPGRCDAKYKEDFSNEDDAF
ncbi:hypothetical protein EV182_000630 [Spiromyces aspiralis]|uniref:Uncharacterized protein n=1 Tax=Spiromyces aspiralis TaxID=68401 RepID=A0ACC1HYA9_9FUNG|nr:hypothetical protein EV182_000630 [Spiromyces aspiralis]